MSYILHFNVRNVSFMVSNQKANMSTLEKLNTTLENGGASTEEALKFFDELESVNLEFMIGRWQGYEFPTNHPMDGLLKASAWYGEEFVDAEKVSLFSFNIPKWSNTHFISLI